MKTAEEFLKDRYGNEQLVIENIQFLSEMLKAYHNQKLAEMMPSNSEIYSSAAKHSNDCKIGGEVTNGASYRDGAMWLKNKFKSLLKEEK